jgi:hypothetical protein
MNTLDASSSKIGAIYDQFILTPKRNG